MRDHSSSTLGTEKQRTNSIIPASTSRFTHYLLLGTQNFKRHSRARQNTHLYLPVLYLDFVLLERVAQHGAIGHQPAHVYAGFRYRQTRVEGHDHIVVLVMARNDIEAALRQERLILSAAQGGVGVAQG